MKYILRNKLFTLETKRLTSTSFDNKMIRCTYGVDVSNYKMERGYVQQFDKLKHVERFLERKQSIFVERQL